MATAKINVTAGTERRYGSNPFATSALGGGRSALRCSRLTPWKDAVPFVQQVGWASGPVWLERLRLT